MASKCTCDAYPFPHRTGGGDCDECGCEDAPLCEHWEKELDPYGTGDHWFTAYWRISKQTAIRRIPK